MKRILIVAISASGVLSSCRKEPSEPSLRASRELRVPAAPSPVRLALTVTESRLIRDLVALFPDSERESVSRSFADPMAMGMTATSPRAQAIIDTIMTIRKARLDSIGYAMERAPRVAYEVTVVLVPQLSEPGASAVVWRRTRETPHDVIVLRADHATVGTLGAGIQALADLRRRSGDSTSVDEHVVVHGERMPKRWDAEVQNAIRGELYALERMAPIAVPPFGTVRSRILMLAPVGRATATIQPPP